MKFICLVFLASVSWAQKKEKSNALDFEADVIEAERKSPELFIQLSLEKAKTGNLKMIRKSFNDRLEIDLKTRPRYQEK